MDLSWIGGIVQNYWDEIPKHYKNVLLDEYIIMPNHVHGIIIINYQLPVETCHGMSLRKQNQFSKPISQSLSMIVNHFKSAVTRQCRKKGFTKFQWQ